MNELERSVALRLIHQGCEPEPGRYTSDVPINSEVWLMYTAGHRFSRPHNVLLTPHLELGVVGLRSAVLAALPVLADKRSWVRRRERDTTSGQPAMGSSLAHPDRYLATTESHLMAHIDFFELLALLPLTRWWGDTVVAPFRLRTVIDREQLTQRLVAPALCRHLGQLVPNHVYAAEVLDRFHTIGAITAQQFFTDLNAPQRDALARLINIAALQVGLSMLGLPERSYTSTAIRQRAQFSSRRVLRALAAGLRADVDPAWDHEAEPQSPAPLWQVACNRPAQHALHASRRTVKADAAIRVFDTGGRGVRWAVIDAGIDARHPALAGTAGFDPTVDIVDGLCRPSQSRVVKTLDFTRLAAITSGASQMNCWRN